MAKRKDASLMPRLESPHLGRRSFLGLAAATASFNIVRAATPRTIEAGRRIRVALIGCGLRMGVLCTKCEDVEIVALVDPWTRALDRIRTKLCKLYPGSGYEKIPAFPTYQDLFAKMGDAIDAVIIATNQQQHALPALLAMQRGIHVYIEKPIAYSIEEAELMLSFEEVWRGVAVRAPWPFIADHGDGGGVHPKRRARAGARCLVL